MVYLDYKIYNKVEKKHENEKHKKIFQFNSNNVNNDFAYTSWVWNFKE